METEVLQEIRHHLSEATKLLDQHGQPAARAQTDQLMTIAEAARILNVSEGYLYLNWHKMPFAFRVGQRAVRISQRKLEAYIRERRS